MAAVAGVAAYCHKTLRACVWGGGGVWQEPLQPAERCPDKLLLVLLCVCCDAVCVCCVFLCLQLPVSTVCVLLLGVTWQ